MAQKKKTLKFTMRSTETLALNLSILIFLVYSFSSYLHGPHKTRPVRCMLLLLLLLLQLVSLNPPPSTPIQVPTSSIPPYPYRKRPLSRYFPLIRHELQATLARNIYHTSVLTLRAKQPSKRERLPRDRHAHINPYHARAESCLKIRSVSPNRGINTSSIPMRIGIFKGNRFIPGLHFNHRQDWPEYFVFQRLVLLIRMQQHRRPHPSSRFLARCPPPTIHQQLHPLLLRLAYIFQNSLLRRGVNDCTHLPRRNSRSEGFGFANYGVEQRGLLSDEDEDGGRLCKGREGAE